MSPSFEGQVPVFFLEDSDVSIEDIGTEKLHVLYHMRLTLTMLTWEQN
jgi:hypothetical protein